ncbi:Ig-like domain repeat protein [Jiangella endophytica]|uniref:Ig-like domain repeat protein n=1 Tax=Jiangella endophytica TaxID=1623398 RepID=UPI0013004E70|nr:Ig-like domain repeat protein [Jiangella endophytica]
MAAVAGLGLLAGGLAVPPGQATQDVTVSSTVTAAPVVVPDADVLDVDFEDGTPVEHTQNLPARTVGAPVYGTDPGVPGTVATFDGDDALVYPFTAQWSKLTTSFSVECVFRFDGDSPDQHGNVCSDAEGGGIAIDVGGGVMEVWAHIGGAYKRINARLEPGRWYHATAVWDGSTLFLYVDGRVASQIAATGALRLPPAHAQNWVLGADAASNGALQSYSLSSIESARVYSQALTAEQVAVLADAAFEDEESVVTLLSPRPGEQIGGGTVALTGVVTRPTDVSFRLDGGDPVSLGRVDGTFDAQLTEVATGTHTVEVTATADDGTAETETVEFSVDATGPEITVRSPRDGATYDGVTVTVDVVANDPAGVDELELELDGEPIADGAVIDPETVTDGEHTLVATATDGLLNTSTSTVTFTTAGNQPDAPSDPGPADGATDVPPGAADLSVTALDPAGDVLAVEFKRGYEAAGAAVVREGTSANARPGRGTGDPVADADAVAEADDDALTTSAEGAYPFQQFEVTVPADIDAARFTVEWAGQVPRGHRAELLVWNHATRSWQLLADGDGGRPLTLSGEVRVDETVREGVAQVLVQDAGAAVVDDDDVVSFAWMSDTQWYSNKEPETYQKMVDWVVTNRAAKDLSYGVHTGDIVQTPNAAIEWARASEIMRTWDEAGFPYGLVPGNHDDVGGGEYRPYREHFGGDRYEDNPWYGGTVADNVQHYDVLSTPKADFLVMYLDWTLDDAEIAWANEIIQAHPDHNVIIATHWYIGGGGVFTGPGQRIFDEIVVPNDNVDLVLCGHIHNTAYNIKHLEDGRVVVEVLYDTQELPTAGGGWMRTIDFDTVAGTMTHDSFSVLTPEADSAFGDPAAENFTTPLQLDTPTRSIATDRLGVSAWGDARLGLATGVTSGERAAVTVDGLTPDTTYQWYAQATDPDGYYARSPIWEFTTGAGAGSAASEVTARPVTQTYGTPVEVSATVTPSGATGTVTFGLAGGAACVATVTGGVASCSLGILPAGTHEVSAAYSGDAEYAPSTGTARVTVRRAPAEFAAGPVNDPVPPGEPAVLTATLAPSATGEVRFDSRGSTLCVAVVEDGTASCETAAGLKPGPYSVVASYDGDPNHLPDQARFVFRAQR